MEDTDEKGAFTFSKMPQLIYQLKASFVGLSDIVKLIEPKGKKEIDLGIIQFESVGIELHEVVVTASRAIVEAKRTELYSM
ncbi:MAG: hypothetical protein ACJA01_002972 [Saprospiraceae bacterium]